jgi:hypothetical protein
VQQQQEDGGTTSTGGNVDLQTPLEPIPRVEFRPLALPPLPPKP